MEGIVLVVALVTILVALAVICFVAYLTVVQFRTDHPTPSFFQKRAPVQETPDQYTPEVTDQTVPLDQFTPDFSKPMTYRVKREGEQDIMEEEEATT